MTFVDLQAMRRVSDPQISPSGRWVVFSVTEVDLARNSEVNHLWVTPLGAGSPPGTGRQVSFWKGGEQAPRFRPDGRELLFQAEDERTGEPQIYLAPWNDATGEMGTPRQLTHLSTGAEGGVWSPDGTRVLATSRVYPACSDEASWLAEESCDRDRKAADAANPVKAQLWTHLLYRHWNQYVGDRRSHLLAIAAGDGNDIRDLTPRRVVGDAEVPPFSLGGPPGYAWAPDGHEIAYVANLDPVPAASTNNDVWMLRIDEAGAAPEKISQSTGSDDAPAYSPDGRWLLFRSQARAGYESDRFRLMLWDRQARSAREVLPKFDRWVDEFVWAPDSDSIYLTGANLGAVPVFRMKLKQRYLTQLTDAGDFGSLGVTADGRTVVATRMSVAAPAEVVAIAPDSARPAPAEALPAPATSADAGPRASASSHAPARSAGRSRGQRTSSPASPTPSGAAMEPAAVRPVTAVNGRLLAQLDLPPTERFWFAGAQGAEVEGFVLRPPGFVEGRRYPVKLLIHGGPQGAWGDSWSYRWNAELFAADGYVVVMINPRGSTGYGQAFIDGVNGDWGGKPYVDLMRGMDVAEARFPAVDKARECALGASYGGYMADWVLTHTNRFRCIVTHDGMVDPVSAYGATDELWFNEWEFRSPGSELPGQPWRYSSGPADQDPFRRWSPMRSIANAQTPTLVIHSQRDYRLDVSQGFELFTALQREGVPSEMLYFPDEGHWVQKPQNSELWYRTVNGWCDRWTHAGAQTSFDGLSGPGVPARQAGSAP